MDINELKMAKKKAREVFGEDIKINKWFNTKNKALGNKTPKECELNEVLELIIRIEYGTYS